MKKKNCLYILPLLLLLVLAAAGSVRADDTIGLDVQKHTRQELTEYSRAHYPSPGEIRYDEDPVLTAPYDPGALSEESLEDGLGALNYVRYVAGLSYDVVLDGALNEKVQAGALVNAVNNELSHTPAQPEGMPDELYELGCSGTSSSNLAAGYGNLADAVLNGWMDDSDAGNIDRLGHRRWVLNPKMGKTGFGYCGNYCGMYAFDRSNTSAAQTLVAWPAQLMPTVLMRSDMAWSLSLDRKVSADDVTVILTRRSDGKQWTMGKGGSDGYFNVDTGGYGQGCCIIFLPYTIQRFDDGDVYDVRISGALDRDIAYSVEFVDLIQELGMDELTVTADSLSLCPYTADSTTVRMEYSDYYHLYAEYSGILDLDWISGHEVRVSVDSGSGTAFLSFELAHPYTGEKVRRETLYFTVYQGTWVPYLVSAGNLPDGVRISWEEPVDFEDGYLYEVLRKTGNGELASVGVTEERAFVDGTAEEGVTYTYTVRCLAPDGSIPTSNYDVNGLTIRHQRGGWVREGGSWYYYASGTRQTGWVQDGGRYYYMDAGGAMQTGWQKIGGVWYYFAESGAMQTGWQQIGGKWYYFNAGGDMAAGWKNISGKWYYLNSGGDMATGWKNISGKWYYFNAGGDMATGWKNISGKWYYLNSGGDMATGWKNISGKWYYLNSGGDMATGWKNIDGKWYYLNSSGDMATGWKNIDGKWYYLNISGEMAAGWKKIDGSWYYFNPGGDMRTGWLQSGDKWYYLKSSGVMAADEVASGHLFDTSGAWVCAVTSTNEQLAEFKDADYFVPKNLDRYVAYGKNNAGKTTDETVRAVNANIDRAFYTGIQSTDMSKGYQILCNKYYQLARNYVPELTALGSAYGSGSMETTAAKAFRSMADAAKKDGITLKSVSAYRSYATQNSLYNGYVSRSGKAQADTYSARPGHSEHQTGLAVDINCASTSANFQNTKEYAWLVKNSYLYGFILRYPAGKQYITGYIFEPWHFRYVGVEAATQVTELGITYEEYYAYFVDN